MNQIEYRDYNPEKDKKAVHRIWLECGWLENDNVEPMDIMVESCRSIVVDVNGQPECLVVSFPGDIDYIGERLPLSCIGAVATSLIARKQNIASRLTAARIALDAEEGAAISCLGMFEQGFYNKLGYGTGGYDLNFHFAPSILNVKNSPGVPVRLTEDDWVIVHRSRLNRMRSHGSCSMIQPEISQADIRFYKGGFGYGYIGKTGELTHHIWMNGQEKEHGPYEIQWMAYRNYEQFIELLALIKSFGEQVHLVKMNEPPSIQMQDFLDKPFFHRQISKKSPYENTNRADAWWQMRICDLETCITNTHLQGDYVEFNLELSDPIEKYLGNKLSWRGVAGNYIIKLGDTSSVEVGYSDSLPILKASVGAFTRLWLGVLPASSLAICDDLEGSNILLSSLDKLMIIPKPMPDWLF
ncbi:MAG: GNAT family N-acetyltransferase [Candidatus Electryonea clarkiae]|nr:GNAT family N-acetyltransferase [Candidatus Electryonea clarkiae]MDP8289189.1 GNAT family N-acetyltransferase [Candidatus Electryonea clarkiae]